MNLRAKWENHRSTNFKQTLAVDPSDNPCLAYGGSSPLLLAFADSELSDFPISTRFNDFADFSGSRGIAMFSRLGRFGLVLLICVGCRNVPKPSTSPNVVPNNTDEPPRVRLPNHSPTEDVTQVTAIEEAPTDHLTKASVCLEKSDEEGAIRHLAAHVQKFPDQIMIRASLAELLFKRRQLPVARIHFEEFVVHAQATTGAANHQLVHAHMRLMAIAQASGDSYAESLHRGIGFVLLARKMAEGLDEPEEGFREKVLCRAATELTKARTARPEEARPSCYLHEVYRHLEQPRPAERSLREAAKALSTLTPSEQRYVLDHGPIPQ